MNITELAYLTEGLIFTLINQGRHLRGGGRGDICLLFFKVIENSKCLPQICRIKHAKKSDFATSENKKSFCPPPWQLIMVPDG